MNNIIKLFIYLACLQCVALSQFSYKQDKLLSRKRRFLRFPENSNMVITYAGIANVQIQVPKGYIVTIECDTIFKLPTKSDIQKYKKKYFNHIRQRRQIYRELSRTIDMNGFNGTICVNKFLCEVNQITIDKSSLFEQIITTIFTMPEIKKAAPTKNYCERYDEKQCQFSLQNLISNL